VADFFKAPFQSYVTPDKNSDSTKSECMSSFNLDFSSNDDL